MPKVPKKMNRIEFSMNEPFRMNRAEFSTHKQGRMNRADFCMNADFGIWLTTSVNLTSAVKCLPCQW